MTANKHEVYVLSPKVLAELKDCIAYADTLSCYKILSEFKPVQPIGYVIKQLDNNYCNSVIKDYNWTPYQFPVYITGEQNDS